ncbi:hypothetical protein [Thermohalobacter berrensis]|uniref:DUF3566 domain-containing protein n=1 Tax=Thermohalobacter berrensis TaxID=99594 RepID=A0A419T4Z2_9FIRM|nr:hypothetical protein [Thermohalobacter berrensis]RKD32458.1 hypothetical protein BET03_11130 [Thermohalobacter berrensis]
MKYQIKNISGHQTSKVIATITAIISSVFALIGLFISLLVSFALPGDFPVGSLIMFIFIPLIYFAIGYLVIRIFTFLYNRIASRMGGIEFELSEDDIKDI